jgi:hypothetical protein
VAFTITMDPDGEQLMKECVIEFEFLQDNPSTPVSLHFFSNQNSFKIIPSCIFRSRTKEPGV